MNQWIGLTLISLCLTACSSDSDSSDNGGDSGPGPDANIQEAEINGVPASEFYGEFVWEKNEGSLNGAASFPESNGFNAMKWDFFLFENGSYDFYYGEGSGTVSSTGASLSLDSSTYRKAEGQWSVEGTKLILAPYLECGGLELNGNNVLSCELTQAIGNQAAQGNSGIARHSIPSDPFDSDWSEYPPL